MAIDRRMFLKAGAASVMIDAASLHASAEPAVARTALDVRDLGRMAYSPATHYAPYVSKLAHSASAATWVQIDLGSSVPIQAVRLYPAFNVGRSMSGYGFPVRFKIEASDTPSMVEARTLVDYTAQDFADPADHITEFRVNSTLARYVRLTAAQLRKAADGIGFRLALNKIDVVSNGKDVAQGRAVSADPEWSNPEKLSQLTRHARPMGEGIVTDNIRNVSESSQWRPPVKEARTPLSGVELHGGVFRHAMDNNIEYLLRSFSVDEMLRPFRERAGKPVAAGLRKPVPFWDTELPGSSAGRFLMGAGNTLRWIDHKELRAAMNDIVAGIAECRAPNGYIMGYPEETIFESERGGYTRAWVTHGLIEAGYAGNAQAFELLRGYYDWFDRCQYLPKLLRGGTQGVQGMIANTRLYFTPVGKPEDIQVIQRYFQENYWLTGLADRDPIIVWQYPYDRPHNYLITDFEAYMDLFGATGDPKYLNAVLGAWDLYRDNWEHVGGSIAITEFGEFPPKSYRLNEQMPFCETGETCGSVFWVRLNQRLHLLHPEQEKYVTEIEKSIYNVGLANQVAGDGIIYHARLVGRKGDVHVPLCTNSCCEGQGTRLLGSLPEYIYSLAADGLYINLYAPSSIKWGERGSELALSMSGDFPFAPDMKLTVSVAGPTAAVIRVRVPSWAAHAMPIHVNGKPAGVGAPGTYVTLSRSWSDGDVITFTLPMDFRMTRYTGLDRIPGHERFALEYGPILLALLGSDSAMLKVPGGARYDEFVKQLKPDPDRPLHFHIDGHPEYSYVPYWQIVGEPFTCFPVVDLA